MKKGTQLPKYSIPSERLFTGWTPKKKGLCRCPDIPGLRTLCQRSWYKPLKICYLIQGLFSLKYIFLSLDTNTLESQVGQKQDSRGSAWEEHKEQKPADLDLQSCRLGQGAAGAGGQLSFQFLCPVVSSYTYSTKGSRDRTRKFQSWEGLMKGNNPMQIFLFSQVTLKFSPYSYFPYPVFTALTLIRLEIG